MNLTAGSVRAGASEQPALQAEELESLDRVLRELGQALRAMLGDLPVEAQTASGLSRATGVERTTCQRVVSAVTGAHPGPSLLAQLPGPRGLRTLVESLVAAGLAAGEAPGLLRKIEGLDGQIRSLGGSRSGLIRRLDGLVESSGSKAGAPRVRAQAREVLFDAARELTGRWSDLWLAAHVYTPGDGSDRLVQSRVHGLSGHRSRPDAVPLTFHVFSTEIRGDGPEQPGAFRPLLRDQPDAILRTFSTEPLPVVRSKTPGEHVVQTIESDAGSALEAPIDLMFGLRGLMTHPATRANTLEEVWALVNFPVRRMVFDVYLHRSLARQCIPGLDHHLWRPDFDTQAGERWQTRFSESPRLEVLAPGAWAQPLDAYPRYPELVGLMFEVDGLEPGDYVGYRCDVTYPAWRTGYRMSFDFGAES